MIKIHDIVKTSICVVRMYNHMVNKIITTQKWSNIDEYAHMDYIEKLAIGQMPLSSDQICNEIFLLHHQLSWKICCWKTINKKRIIDQAQHPPLYYSVLLAPNMLMKKMNVDVFSRVIVLQLFIFFCLVVFFMDTNLWEIK